ncbi:MAG: SWIM zinc finger family protein [Dehalococcoidales bacterium]
MKNGIKTKNERGAIGETWWSKRWIHVLESLGMGARLDRGRSYARRGQVVSIDVQKSVVTAKVQGSRPKPYSITIRLVSLSDKDWDKVIDIMASQAIFAAKLLSGEMPQNIEEAFVEAKVSLFPRSGKDLDTDCSCPDYANPCKHIAAVYYILAERFDSDPFLIFKLRGRTKEEIIQALRKKRGQILVEKKQKSTEAEIMPDSSVTPIEDCLGNFWQAGEALDSFITNPALPEIEGAILKRLGKPPLAIGGENMTTLMTKAYAVASKAALRAALGKPASKKN